MKLCSTTTIPCALLLAWASVARAEYSDPPDGSVTVDYPDHRLHRDGGQSEEWSDEPYVPTSSLRLLTGPALRVSEHGAHAGLFAAADVGRRAVGMRLTGTWVGTGTEVGLSQYSAELWLDLGAGRTIHPIFGAGAGLSRVSRSSGTAEGIHTESVGVGTVRASVHYQLPIDGSDARAGLDAIGSVPAVWSRDTEPVQPWALVVATVAVGF